MIRSATSAHLARIRSSLPLLRSAGLVGSAEIINRVTHVATAIAVARSLSIAEVGIAAAALTVHELTRMFIQNGLGTRVVAARDDEVETVATAVHRLNWWLGIAVATVQLGIATIAWRVYGSPVLASAIAALALVHVIYPLSMVRVYLAQREGRWRLVSATIAGQAVADNLLTVALAVAGWGIWAMVLPKVLVAPLWVIWHRRATPWCATGSVDAGTRRTLATYGATVLGSEILSSLRGQADRALVGIMFGPVALGLYAFASNIANSITIGLAQAIGAVLLPVLRTGRDKGNVLETFATTLTTLMLPVLPVVGIQAALASWYVPIVFGDKWSMAVPLIVIMSVASVTRPVLVATSQLLRAVDQAALDAGLSALTTALFFTGLLAGSAYGIEGAAIGCALGLGIGAVVSTVVAILKIKSAQAAAPAASPA